MGISSDLRDDGIRVVTMDHPPVNALTVQGWFDVAAALDEAGRDPDTHVVVLRAEGRGFNAGVDIKEMQHTTGFDALIGANRGCYAAFTAVYECAVPVIAAVHGLLPRRRRRPGRQRRLSWSPATTPTSACPRSTAARSARPPTWPGWCRQHLMRTLYFTGRTITAADLVQHGSVLEVVPRDRLDDAALARRRRDRRQGHPGDPGAPRRRSTASTRSTSTRATGSSRASPRAQPRPASATSCATTFAGTDKAARQ